MKPWAHRELKIVWNDEGFSVLKDVHKWAFFVMPDGVKTDLYLGVMSS